MTYRIPIVICLLLPACLLTSVPGQAFDDDRTISDIHLKDESFLDISSHSYRKSLDLDWYDTLNGWRMGGGSVSQDRAFLQTDMRLIQPMSDSFSFGLELEQENFYARKPFPLPLLFFDVYPLAGTNIGVSFLGTPAYDKRQSDLGYAVTFGRRPENYLRLIWLEVDPLYNEKNEFDESHYDKYGETYIVKGAHKLDRDWYLYYDLTKDTPLDFVFKNLSSRFQHESYNYKAVLVRRITSYQAVGINLRTLDVDKRLLETGSSERQQIEYQSADLYWIHKRIVPNHELTMGVRYDTFGERFRDDMANNRDYDFELTTSQAYATLFHPYALHRAWELGLYLGWSERSKEYVISNPESYDDSGIQGKLRTSWQYHTADMRSVILFSMTFNLDDLAADPGDGGGIYYQNLF